MKKYLLILITAIVGIVWSSCKDDKEILTLNNDNAVPATLLTPADGSAFTLTAAQGADTFNVFSWTKAEYGISLSQEYSLQLDVDGGGFSNPVAVNGPVALIVQQFKLTNADLNLTLFDAGATGTVDANFRVRTVVSNDAVDTLYSAPNKVSITMFDYNKPTLTLPASGSNIELLKTDGANDFSFKWDRVNYGGPYNDRYTIQFDLPGNDFAKNQQYAKVFGDNVFTDSVGALNKFLVSKLKLPVGVATTVECRVMGMASSQTGTIYSDVSTFTITPFDASATTVSEPPLYLVGAFNGWDNTAGLPIVYDAANNVYTLTTDFVEGNGMKILKTSGAWAPQWGDDGSFTGKLSYRPDEATTDPPEIPSPGTGSYKMIVDIDNLTYSFEAQ